MEKIKSELLGLILIFAAVALYYLVGSSTALVFANLFLILGIILMVKGFPHGDRDEEEKEEKNEE